MVGPKKQDFWQRINILERILFLKIPLMNDGSSKIGHDFRNKSFLKLILSENVFNKSWCPKLTFFNEKKLERFGQFLT